MRLTKYLLVVAFAMLFSVTQAQIEGLTPNTWKITSVKGNFGAHADHFSNMSLNFMEGRINDENYNGVNISGLNAQDYTMSTTGGNINLGLMLSRIPSVKGIGKYETLELAVGVHIGREVMIDYYNTNPAAFCADNNLTNCYSDITFCDLQNELSVSAIYRKGISFYNLINFYSGVGTSFGSTMASQMWVFADRYNAQTNTTEYVEEVYSLNESILGRVFIPIGGEIVLLDKLHLIAEGRFGVGYNYSLAQGGAGNLNYSVLGGLAWNI